jgi:hypothetical protein
MRYTFLFSGLLQGIWLLIDAFQLYRRVQDRFSQDELWDRALTRLGIQPESMAPLFFVLGVLWLFSTFANASGKTRMRPFAKALAIGTLWYAIPGTVLSVLHLASIRTLPATQERD